MREAFVKLKKISLMVVVVVLSVITTAAADGQCKAAAQKNEEPMVTRWMDPLGRPRPRHEPLFFQEPLQLEQVKLKHPEGFTAQASTTGRICIVVHQDIYSSIASNLSQYQTDLISAGFSVLVYQYSAGSAESLRSYLAGLYNQSQSLVGVVLIGDIPYIIYEMMQFWEADQKLEYEDFPCDIFYMDLDGTWSDELDDGQVQAGNGKYDTRKGNMDLEVWACRMKTDNLTKLGSESDILNTYFNKNHRYRVGTLTATQQALAYIDDDWEHNAVYDAAYLGWWYGDANVTRVSNPEATTTADYKNNHLTAPYEFMFIRSHGYSNGHGFYRNNMQVFEYVYEVDYLNYDPEALFYSLFVCSGSDYSADNYLAGAIAFNPDESGLFSWGSTKSGGMLSDSVYYYYLYAGEVFGEAFKRWFNWAQSTFAQKAPRWWYGMVLIGDAALHVSPGGGGGTPVLQLSKTQMNFGATGTGIGTNSQRFLISNVGGGASYWTVNDNANWLNCSPSSGINSEFVYVDADTTGLSPGTYTGTITVSDPTATNSPQTINVSLVVYPAGSTSAPFGTFSTPVHGSVVRSSIPVTGWALDDIGVYCVAIYRGEIGNPTFIGYANFVEGALPTVAQAYPNYPMNSQAGWGYMMLTNFLPNGGNGPFKIHAIATDMEGNSVTLGTKTITCDNANAVKPFGAIDTPAQGGTAAGTTFANHGWALTPLPNSISTDGSTIHVYVDGVNLGHPTYNVKRDDIAALFPNNANSNGAGGYFYFNTRNYTNGVHTIYWIAADDAGNVDGIGSRFFTIYNLFVRASTGNQSAPMQQPLKDAWNDIPLDYFEPVTLTKGYHHRDYSNEEKETIYPDEKGIIYITIEELERIEIHLGHHLYAGYLSVGNLLRPLPIGSTLDTGKGIFYWQPGPVFLGEYRLLFARKWPNGEMSKRDIMITIVPKFANTIYSVKQ